MVKELAQIIVNEIKATKNQEQGIINGLKIIGAVNVWEDDEPLDADNQWWFDYNGKGYTIEIFGNRMQIHAE